MPQARKSKKSGSRTTESPVTKEYSSVTEDDSLIIEQKDHLEEHW